MVMKSGIPHIFQENGSAAFDTSRTEYPGTSDSFFKRLVVYTGILRLLLRRITWNSHLLLPGFRHEFSPWRVTIFLHNAGRFRYLRLRNAHESLKMTKIFQECLIETGFRYPSPWSDNICRFLRASVCDFFRWTGDWRMVIRGALSFFENFRLLLIRCLRVGSVGCGIPSTTGSFLQ